MAGPWHVLVSTALKHCTKTEILWNRKVTLQRSSDTASIYLPRSFNKRLVSLFCVDPAFRLQLERMYAEMPLTAVYECFECSYNFRILYYLAIISLGSRNGQHLKLPFVSSLFDWSCLL